MVKGSFLLANIGALSMLHLFMEAFPFFFMWLTNNLILVVVIHLHELESP